MAASPVMAADPAPPDAWAVDAACLPLAFAQVREDPRLDLQLAGTLDPGATVVMIASGGETAACLAHLPLRLHLVDMNSAQLALSRLKWQLAGNSTADEAAMLLGHLPMSVEERTAGLSRGLSGLSLASDVFGPLERVAELGPDHAGRYEIAFSELRGRLASQREDLEQLLCSPSPVALEDGDLLGKAMTTAFHEVMALPNLVCLFGEAATQNPRRPFAEHFTARTRGVIARMPPRSNPFLWQILAGRFPPGVSYDWLESCGRPLAAEATWHHGQMDAVLDNLPAGSADLVHLSNILDWLSAEEAGATLCSVRRVLKPGGRVILRQLNSTLDVPRLEAGIHWDAALGAAMEASDRSYFYPEIHVGIRP